MKIKFTDQTPALTIPIRPTVDANLVVAQNYVRAGNVKISMAADVIEQALTFLRTSDFEQGGLLLGRIWADSRQPDILDEVEVLAIVPSIGSTSGAYSLQMTASVWSAAQTALKEINQALPQDEQPLRIVGWFHSHPRFGAFFSQTDIDTQKAFFNQPYSVGWVLDPYSNGTTRAQALYLSGQCIPAG